MNRSTTARDSSIGTRNFPAAGLQHRRGRSLTRAPRDADENLDLFSKNRRTLSAASSDESDVSLKLGGVSVGSAKVAKCGADDLLLSTDGGKNDYDWLLTPPGTPLFPSSVGSESQQTLAAPRSSSLARSATKSSRLSVSQSETSHSSRPTRSSSAHRPSISSTQYSTYTSSRSSSILNTSSASVSSYIRPSSPSTRSPSSTRNPAPSTRPASSRSSTPSRTRQASTNNSSIEKSRPSHTSRPSTPTSRPQIQPNSNLPTARLSSRPSTPTRRNSTPSLSMSSGFPASAGRVQSNGRSSAPASRASSPSPKVRSSQPVILPDFPLDTPPNLRTTLPDRPLSAGRSRPGVATMKSNTESMGPSSLPRRHSSPTVSRGRSVEPAAKGRLHGNGNIDSSEYRKAPNMPELAMRKPVKPSATTTERTGFGRTISKNSLDMAIRHMDIRSGANSTRPLSGTTLFPQSVRSATPRTQVIRAATGNFYKNNGSPISSNSRMLENGGNHVNCSPENGRREDIGRVSGKLSEADIFESSRYDAILLKEDLSNTNWLHSVDDRSDQGPIFDNGFEPLPELFNLL